jgi:hypothetical protein
MCAALSKQKGAGMNRALMAYCVYAFKREIVFLQTIPGAKPVPTFAEWIGAYRHPTPHGCRALPFDPVAFHPLALHLAGAANSGGFFSGTLFAWLFIVAAQFHFAIHALTLQLFLQRAQSLINIVIANHDLHIFKHPKFNALPLTNRFPSHLRDGSSALQ